MPSSPKPERWPSAAGAIAIRRYAADDFDSLVAGWHATNRASYPYVAEHQRHTLDDARAFFAQVLVPRCEIWVAHVDGDPCGLIAREGPWIRQLAVFPPWQRRGVGGALLAAARAAAPGELRLFTFRRNERALAFYARHGFVPVAFGVSPAPESEPDVELRWVA